MKLDYDFSVSNDYDLKYENLSKKREKRTDNFQA
jgi:hypothetical protein